MTRVLVFSLAAAIALASMACGAETPDGAASAVEEASPKTYRFETVSRSPGEPQTAEPESRLSGAVDREQDRREYVDHTNGCRTITIGPSMYIERPKDGVSGTEWLYFADLAASPTARREVGQAASLGTPATTLETIRAAGGEPRRIGEEAVRGAPTTRYRARLDLGQVIRLEHETSGRSRSEIDEFLRPDDLDGVLDVEVWIGDDGLVRRVVEQVVHELDETLSLPGSVETTEFFDFGLPVDIEPPHAEAVVDSQGWSPYPEPSDDADAESAWEVVPCRR